ncbi:hypothetical protein PF008_g20620 [Phytophthora fragariae]|uniref:Mitochondrial cardiolipin hydrolase n=1 Tax=Phytophthora fragariae TaxID=53985 RepID=A0A6G0QZ02_9STRA|nr:hypothetical protein PF008_g20620 [Phytophthora fragariae]
MIKPKGRKPQWPVPKAVVEIAKVLPEIHLTNDVISRAAEAVGIPKDNFRYIQSEVKTRLQTAVVDLWFGGDSRGEREVLRYIQEAERSIKIGVDSLTNEEVVRELAAAVGRRVKIMLVVDLKKSHASGLEDVKALLEAGVQVCHCTEDLQCRAAIFDGQILVQGSQSWTENNQESSSMDYSMVLTGPIVSDFECQFDSMWSEAAKTLKNGDKKANDGIVMDQNHDAESSEELSGTEARKMTNKRKRAFFPTTFELLALLGM